MRLESSLQPGQSEAGIAPGPDVEPLLREPPRRAEAALRALRSGSPLAKAFSEAMALLEDPIGAQHAVVFGVDGQRRSIELETMWRLEPGDVCARYAEGVAGRVGESGTPIVVPRVTGEPTAVFELAQPTAWQDRDVCLVSVPVSTQGRCHGVLSVYMARRHELPLPERVAAVMAVASAMFPALPTARATLAEAVERLERKMIEEALQEARGNLARAARALGTTERIVRYKARKYGIAPSRR